MNPATERADQEPEPNCRKQAATDGFQNWGTARAAKRYGHERNYGKREHDRRADMRYGQNASDRQGAQNRDPRADHVGGKNSFPVAGS